MPKKRSAAGADDAAAASPPIWPPSELDRAAADGDRAALIERRVRRAVHDLRQPVQAMRLFVHLLSTRLEREQDRALVTKLDAALENVDGGLRDLMASIKHDGVAVVADPEADPAAEPVPDA